MDLQAMQISEVSRMLGLRVGDSVKGTDLWKILIYDATGERTLASLVRVGELRNLGVTIQHRVDDKSRHSLPEVPGIYLIGNGDATVEEIVRDFRESRYDAYHLNFVGSADRAVLTRLAKAAVDTGAVANVCSVADRYIDFLCLDKNCFTLNMRDCYRLLHSTTSDAQIEDMLNRVVDGLLNVLVTMRVLPLIRLSSNKALPTHAVAERLLARLAEMARSHRRLFGSLKEHTLGLAPSQRPLLILFDRNSDIMPLFVHPWSYGGLIHDLYGIDANRTVVVHDETRKECDFDTRDSIWRKYHGETFPDVAVAIKERLDDYNKKLREIGGAGADSSGQTWDGSGELGARNTAMLQTMTKLPELTEEKRYVDLHMNIASALLSDIKRRGLDKYVQLEDKIVAKADRSRGGGSVAPTGSGASNTATDVVGSLKSSVQGASNMGVNAIFREVLTLVEGMPEEGTDPDRGSDIIRLVMAWYLGISGPGAQFDQLCQVIRQKKYSMEFCKFLTNYDSIKNMQKMTMGSGPYSPPGGTGHAAANDPRGERRLGGPATNLRSPGDAVGGSLAMWKDKLLGGGQSILNTMKNMITRENTLEITRVIDSLMTGENPTDFYNTEYIEIETLGCENVDDGEKKAPMANLVERLAIAHKDEKDQRHTHHASAIVFCVGGGSYVETADIANFVTYNNQNARKRKIKSIVYGATDFPRPADLLAAIQRGE